MTPLPQLLWEHRERLPMFTVFAHPSDHPDAYVARLALTRPELQITNLILRHPDLDVLRDELAGLGLTQLSRSPEDPPNIVETWF